MMSNLQEYAKNLSINPDPRAPICLFVMQPYSNEAKIVESALRGVFETEPYWFQIILARDRTLAPDLFENVKKHMDLVDGFVADISDLNANVMIELGMTENDPQERPVFILRRVQREEPPADLKQKLYVQYDLPPEDAKDAVEKLAAQLREKLKTIDAVNQLLRRRRFRYLSMRHLDKVLQRCRLALDQQEKDKLRTEFRTIEELQSQTSEEIAKRTGFDQELAELIVRGFAPVSAARPKA